MTRTYPKTMSGSSMENKLDLAKLHGIVVEFGVNFDQTTIDL